MVTLKDIYCTHTEYDDISEYEIGYAGKILLSDDHSFEGVVANNLLMKQLFVYGKIEKDGIRMFTASEEDKEYPKIYRASLQGKTTFKGTMGITDRYIDLPVTDCKIRLLEPDTYRDYEYDKEVMQIKKAIGHYKTLLGEESRAIYDDVFYTRLHPNSEKNAQNK